MKCSPNVSKEREREREIGPSRILGGGLCHEKKEKLKDHNSIIYIYILYVVYSKNTL